jgi:hypothetical protein
MTKILRFKKLKKKNIREHAIAIQENHKKAPDFLKTSNAKANAGSRPSSLLKQKKRS